MRFRARSCLQALFRGLACLAILTTASLVYAESPLIGSWKQGPLREEFTLQKWFDGCGKAPASGASGGGEIVTVRERGDELTFDGGGRSFATNQCYDPLPTLARDAHSREGTGRSWRTRCSTPPNDPRRASIQTLVVATSDTHIDVVETGRYEVLLADGRCVADIKRSRSFDRIGAPPLAAAVAKPQASVVAPPATSAPGVVPPPLQKPPPSEPEPAAVDACETPGEPARLEVRPSRKLLRTQESYVFRAIVRDSKGCVTPTETTWSVLPTPDGVKRGAVDATGKVSIFAEASDGAMEVVVSAAGKSAKVTVDVTSPAHYDSLLASSGLNALGENDAAAIALIPVGSIGSTDAKAEDNARVRRRIFIGIVSTLAVVLGIVALIGARRARRAAQLEKQAEERHESRVNEFMQRKRARVERHAYQVRAHLESVARANQLSPKTVQLPPVQAPSRGEVSCPACRRDFPKGSEFCPFDGNSLVVVAGNEGLFAGSGGMVCPACKRGFNPGTKNCPFDGDELVPFAMRAAPSEPPTAVRGKICPNCGERFEGTAAFCGKDGTALVLLN